MAEARRAIGGEDKLRGVKTVQVNGKFKRTGGANTLEGDFEVYIETPGKYKRHEETGTAGGPIGERTEVLNGARRGTRPATAFPVGRGYSVAARWVAVDRCPRRRRRPVTAPRARVDGPAVSRSIRSGSRNCSGASGRRSLRA